MTTDRTDIALIALDLDGTAFDARQGTGISDALKSAVAEAQASGVRVILATGRAVVSALPHWQALRLRRGPLIAYNGAEVVEVPQRTRWYRRQLDDEAARRLVALANEWDLLCQVYVGDELWVTREDLRVRQYVQKHKIPAWVRSWAEITAWPEPPIKILLQAEPEVLDRFRAAVAPIFADFPVRFMKSQADYLEMVPAGVGKGPALAWVAERLGVARDQVMAIGDAENDIDMLRWAGLGIAMGQSPPEVKAAADAVTRPVSEDGAAWAIRWALERTPGVGQGEGGKPLWI
ncbi:MAG: Cof-type HAD-IIB family hydrolase [Firmicutes bacterium]|nr:HAD family phosphatase [Alicyclobacillaceae bacterium]MCL6497515.1 Cof-type HAD-IIB family hydrolase [Bacillota bacterium]